MKSEPPFPFLDRPPPRRPPRPPPTAQSVVVEKPSCVLMEDNGLVKRRQTTGAAPGLAPRLYFRWRDHEDFVLGAHLETEPGGHDWADPAQAGDAQRADRASTPPWSTPPASRSPRSQSQVVPVTNDCKAASSAPKERGVAQNLTVGETLPKQQGKKVLGFLCDGMVTRVNFARRPPLRRGLPGLRGRLVAAPALLLPAVAGHPRRHRRRPASPGALPLAPVASIQPSTSVLLAGRSRGSVTFWTPRTPLSAGARSRSGSAPVLE